MKDKFLLFLVFVTEWALLSLEIAAFKIFVPHFGSSLYIWGNIIGIIMIGSSLGYFLGGRIADARPRAELLMKIVMATGVFIFLMPFFARFLLLTIGIPHYLLLASFVYGILLFGIPAVLVEIVPPFVVRLENKKVETTGRSTGSVYGFSTLGGVTGIITASFVMIPLWGTRETLFFAGGALVLCGFLGFLLFKKLVKHEQG